MSGLWMPTRKFRTAHVIQDTLPVGHERIRALFVTDIHRSRAFSDEAMEALARQIEGLHPDLFLLGGDYGESMEKTRAVLRRLSGIPARLGKIGVLGNNDRHFFGQRIPDLIEEAEKEGISLLVNETRALPGLQVAGLDEICCGTMEWREYFDADDRARILLSHYPQALPGVLAKMKVRPHLALAGHTHGGQIRIGALSPYSIGFERAHPTPPGISGKCLCGDVPVWVSNGIGTSRVPLRIGAEPQLHLIEIGTEAEK